MAKRDLAQHLREHRSRGSTASTPACFPTSTPATRSPQPSCSQYTRTNFPEWMPRNLAACNPSTRPSSSRTAQTCNAMATIGAIRGSADDIQTQIGNLEQDSFSGDSSLNSEVSVLNKINAAGVLTLRTVQDSNKLLASLLEQQTILAKQQRDATSQRHQHRHRSPSQHGRQHGPGDRNHHRFTSKLPHAVGVRETDARRRRS